MCRSQIPEMPEQIKARAEIKRPTGFELDSREHKLRLFLGHLISVLEKIRFEAQNVRSLSGTNSQREGEFSQIQYSTYVIVYLRRKESYQQDFFPRR
jgi:hypothetical protein